MGIESVMVQHFSGLGLPLAIPAFWAIALAINIGLNLLVIPVHGATGAATVSTSSYVLIFVLVAIYFRLKTGNDLTTALILKRSELRKLFSANRFGMFPR
jgi:O-antigen/teichoic acid export membrane protein